MAFEAWFRYVPGGTLYPYRLDYGTAAEAQAAEAWLAVNGFWYQRPDNPTVYGTPQTIVALIPTLLQEAGSRLLQEDFGTLVLE